MRKQCSRKQLWRICSKARVISNMKIGNKASFAQLSREFNLWFLLSRIMAKLLMCKNHALLPSNTAVQTFAKLRVKICSSTLAPSDIEFGRFAQEIGNRRGGSQAKTYSLLPYVIENWLFHATNFTVKTSLTEDEEISIAVSKFRNLVLEKKLYFKFKLWDEIPVHKDFPCLIALGFGIGNNHGALLQALSVGVKGFVLGDYLRQASMQLYERDYTEEFDNRPDGVICRLQEFPNYGISETMIKRTTVHSNQILPSNHDHWAWLYYQVLSAARNDYSEVLRICFSTISDKWKMQHRIIFGHALLEAVINGPATSFHSQRWWLNMIKAFGVDIPWMRCKRENGSLYSTYNALEHAALLGRVEVVDKIYSLGCPVRRYPIIFF